MLAAAGRPISTNISTNGLRSGMTWFHGVTKGLSGFFAGFQIAVFAFVGIELVGTAAAETKDPQVSTTKLTMLAAAGRPISTNISTNGLRSGMTWFRARCRPPACSSPACVCWRVWR
jgi:amino acid transporter